MMSGEETGEGDVDCELPLSDDEALDEERDERTVSGEELLDEALDAIDPARAGPTGRIAAGC